MSPKEDVAAPTWTIGVDDHVVEKKASRSFRIPLASEFHNWGRFLAPWRFTRIRSPAAKPKSGDTATASRGAKSTSDSCSFATCTLSIRRLNGLDGSSQARFGRTTCHAGRRTAFSDRFSSSGEASTEAC
jgi:hypothetical protein